MKFALVSDAWKPQVNGVARTLAALEKGLAAGGHQVVPLTPDLFRTLPCPTDREVRLAAGARRRLARSLEALAPDAIHIATEGPLGLAARQYCIDSNLRFTTAYHTKYPEYLQARFHLPAAWTYAVLRRFHQPSSAVMVATETVRRELAARNFGRVVLWTRGVDVTLFRPGCVPALDLPRPVFLYVGRVAAEKSLPDFLELDLPGSELVVGDGHLLPEMRRRYPMVHFADRQEGEALVRHYASADVFVLPSRTETFGLVLLEALACGLPVAAPAGVSASAPQPIGQSLGASHRPRRSGQTINTLLLSNDAAEATRLLRQFHRKPAGIALGSFERAFGAASDQRSGMSANRSARRI